MTALDTLFLPLETGDVPVARPALFIGAAAHPGLKTLDADLWQPFKPATAGLDPARLLPDLPLGGTYALAIINIPKQVNEAKFWIASALFALRPGGSLVMAAANDANGNRLEKWAGLLGLPYVSISKNKARAVWLHRPDAVPDLASEWHVQGQVQKHDIGDGLQFFTEPGVFGWDKTDEGSKLLAAYLPSTLKGTGGDFGAGTGYLSYRVLQHAEQVTTLYLAEADTRALECARQNLENVRGARQLEFVWADLSRPATLPALDFVVMNPPFHEGKKAASGIGQAFIATAAHHLKKGGTLYMVANAHLPYEAILKERFSSVRLLVQDKGYKVFEAVK